MIKLHESDLLHCCGSTRWAHQMAAHSFPNTREVFATGDSIWWGLNPEDWLEAFRAHAGSHVPRQLQSIREFPGLAAEYEEKFGYRFIAPPNVKSASTVLELLRQRLQNDPEIERKLTAEDQRQITHLRLKRILVAHL
jgi:hypothetical protein